MPRSRPDVVIVTTKDVTHDDYICRAMELGCDVITEKPMTTDDREVPAHPRHPGAHRDDRCRVTFNYRYSPVRTQVKELLMSGVIGEVLSVDFHWLLDTRHGADYFRRWHRNKENSGGLMVHKATHHFDLVNWWLSTVPATVYAQRTAPVLHARAGRRLRADRPRRALSRLCPRPSAATSISTCAPSRRLRKLYLDNEQYDGYYRDQCVFSDQIDIEDTMNVLVDYANGVKMTYSLNAFSPWEGYIIAFNGTKGRLEHKCEETVYISGDGSVPGRAQGPRHHHPHLPPLRAGLPVSTSGRREGGHGGGDAPLLRDIFAPDPGDDRYLRAADHRAGAYSILTGIAANRSMATGEPVKVVDLVQRPRVARLSDHAAARR